jgi:two-component system NarL family sensor kinase
VSDTAFALLMDSHDALERLIAAEQDERRRLALFLHDGPVQQLSGIALMLDGALHSLTTGRTTEAREIIEAALAQHRATIRELRDLSFALEPVVLRDHGFAPAVRALADQAASSHRVAFDVDVDTELGATAGIALYTIIRELVDQALRRGTPTRMRIQVSGLPDGAVVATVADDAEPERRRRSLEAIDERVVQLHGTLEVQTGPEGTETRVSLPAHTARR